MAIIQDPNWRCSNRERHGKGDRPPATWVVRNAYALNNNLLLRCNDCKAQLEAHPDEHYQVAALLTSRVRRAPDHDQRVYQRTNDDQFPEPYLDPSPQPAD